MGLIMNYRKKVKHRKSVNGGGMKKHVEKIIDDKSGCVIIVTSCDPKTKIDVLNGR